MKKNKCMMNSSGLLATLLLLITGLVMYAYLGDPNEEADGLLVALTLIMNVGGSIFILVSIATTRYDLYCKLKIGLYAILAVFTIAVIAYCFLIIERGQNYDDLVCLIICYVIFLIAGVFALMIYDTAVEEQVVETSAEEPKSALLPTDV